MVGGRSRPRSLVRNRKHVSRQCCVVLCACVHRQIGFEHMSLGIERESTICFLVFSFDVKAASPRSAATICVMTICVV